MIGLKCIATFVLLPHSLSFSECTLRLKAKNFRAYLHIFSLRQSFEPRGTVT